MLYGQMLYINQIVGVLILLGSYIDGLETIADGVQAQINPIQRGSQTL